MSKTSNIIDTDIEITIKYAKVKVHVADELFDENEIKEIEFAVSSFSREIKIDKTYVAFDDSKYEKHFLTEHGWKKLCKLLKKTKFGHKATTEENEIIQTAYYLMIISYIYMCLKDIGYDSDGIYLEIPEKSIYMVEVYKDTYNEYSRYPGKWQTWNSL